MIRKTRLTRRELLTGGSVAAVAAIVTATKGGVGANAADNAPRYAPVYFTAAEWAFLNAAVDRLIPPGGGGPGGAEAGVPEFIDRQMEMPYGHGAYAYMQGPFLPESHPTLGYQLRHTPRELYREGIAAADSACQKQYGKLFAAADADTQDRFLAALEKGTVVVNSGPPAAAFFSQLVTNTHEGYFADPMYGGNKNMGAWKMIGFPGARADFADWMDQPGRTYPYGPVSINGKRES